MVKPICKFYQQGTCRNGSRCKFRHIDPQGDQNGNNFGMNSSNLGAFGSNSSSNNQNNSGFGAFGGQSGAFGQSAATKANLGNPFGGQNGTNSGFGNSGFGNASNMNAFGSQQQSQQLQPQQNNGPFGSIGNTMSNGSFGAPSFGGNGVGNTNNGFGNSGFGNSGFGNSGFGNTSNNNNSNIIQTSATSNNGSFGNLPTNLNPFGSQQTSAFGSQQTSAFGSQQTGAFGSQPQQPQQSQPNTVFGTATSGFNSFGVQTSSTPGDVTQSSTNGGFSRIQTIENPPTNTPFGALTKPQSSNPFGTNQSSAQPTRSSNFTNEIYSENLPSDILVIFQATDFKLGKVPDVPPTIEVI